MASALGGLVLALAGGCYGVFWHLAGQNAAEDVHHRSPGTASVQPAAGEGVGGGRFAVFNPKPRGSSGADRTAKVVVSAGPPSRTRPSVWPPAQAEQWLAELSGFEQAISLAADPRAALPQRERALEWLADVDARGYRTDLALMVLGDALGSGELLVRVAAVDSLALIDHPGAADLLLQALLDGAAEVREAALFALLDHPRGDHSQLRGVLAGHPDIELYRLLRDTGP